jgi:hypothetical protein
LCSIVHNSARVRCAAETVIASSFQSETDHENMALTRVPIAKNTHGTDRDTLAEGAAVRSIADVVTG